MLEEDCQYDSCPGWGCTFHESLICNETEKPYGQLEIPLK